MVDWCFTMNGSMESRKDSCRSWLCVRTIEVKYGLCWINTISAFTADNDIYADQLLRWHRHGANVAVLDLRKACLQLHVDQQL